jgi:hypothetical protein
MSLYRMAISALFLCLSGLMIKVFWQYVFVQEAVSALFDS